MIEIRSAESMHASRSIRSYSWCCMTASSARCFSDPAWVRSGPIPMWSEQLLPPKQTDPRLLMHRESFVPKNHPHEKAVQICRGIGAECARTQKELA